MDEREQHLREAHDAARKAHRWATLDMWGQGCLLVFYGLALLLALALGVIVWRVLSSG
jgi:hypothetical protein